MVILNSIESIFSIVLMISLGYLLTARGWFNEGTSKLFSRLVTVVALPPFMIYNLTSTFTKDKLLDMASGLIIPFTSIFVCIALGYVTAKLIKVDPKHQGVFITMVFTSNTIFIGLPVNLALFGDESIPFVLLYYIANTTTFWTLGVYYISRDGQGGEGSIFDINNVKRIFSPPLLGFILGVILVLLNIKPPKFIMDSCKYLGNLTTPISMLFIGTAIHGVKLRDVKISKDMLAIIAGRFIVSPLSVIILTMFFPLSKFMTDVFVIQAAMPVMTQTSIIAKAYDADSEYAAVMTSVTTILAMAAIPIYMMILG